MWFWLHIVPLSWRVSDATPPQTMAPRRPLPTGSASVQWLAGPLNVTFRGLAAVSIGFHRSGRRTRPHPDTFSKTNNQDKVLYCCDNKKTKVKKFLFAFKFPLWDPKMFFTLTMTTKKKSDHIEQFQINSLRCPYKENKISSSKQQQQQSVKLRAE